MSSILIIEDNAKNMKLVRDILRHQGHDTLEATTGEQGIRMAVAHTPDLVLMDIQLPDIDGSTALRRIREFPGLNAMPVLAVSASVMPEEQQQITASGFDAYITKPISLRPFLAAVQRVLAHGRQRA